MFFHSGNPRFLTWAFNAPAAIIGKVYGHLHTMNLKQQQYIYTPLRTFTNTSYKNRTIHGTCIGIQLIITESKTVY